MSHAAQLACFDLQMPPTPKAVLNVLAFHANEDGLAWPSVPKICERTCLGRTAVIGALRWLEEHHVLEVMRGGGSGNSSRYTLTPSEYQGVERRRAPATKGPPREPINGPVGEPLNSPPPEPSDARTVREADVRETNGSAGEQKGSASRTKTVRETDPNRQELSGIGDVDGAHVRVFEGGFEPPAAELPKTVTPKPAALAAIALRKSGVSVSALDPRLGEAVEAGVTAESLVAMHEAYPDKGAGWLITACVNQQREAQQRSQAPRAGPHRAAGGQPALTAAMGKTAQGIELLEGLKSGSRMAAGRTADGLPEAALPFLGKGAG